MKILILLLCFFAATANAQFLEENFDYPAGDSLGAHDWVSFSGGSTNRLLVTSPGLTFPDYAGSGIGNATTLANSGQDAYRQIPFPVDTLSVYLSFMVNVQTGRTGDYFAALLSSTSTTNFTGRVYVKQAANGNLAFGLSKTTAGAGGIFYSDSIYTTNTTYLLCLKYVFNEGSTTNDEVSLFVFTGSAPSTEPSPTIGPLTGTGNDLTDFQRAALRQGSSTSAANLIVDGGYLSNTYNNNVLPVELASFTSQVSRRDVILNWSTNSEFNNAGFDVERSSQGGDWITVGNVSGKGNSVTQNHYSYTDRGLNHGVYSYRLKQIDFNGNFEYFNLENNVFVGIPAEYAMSQNYPNPFNPSTTIDFDLPADSKVSIKIFDMSGKEVDNLVNDFKTAGYYSVKYNASNLSSGIYFYSIQAGEFSQTKKMILVK